MNRLASAALALAIALPAVGVSAAELAAPNASAHHVRHLHHHGHHRHHSLRHEVKMGKLTEPQAKELRADAHALHAKHRAMLQATAAAGTTSR